MLTKIREDFNAARKDKDVVKKQALEAVINDITYLQKSDKAPIEISDSDVIKCVEKQIKILNDQLGMYIYNNIEKYDYCEKQKNILEQYLPEQMSELSVINEIINIINANGPSNKGVIMRQLLPIISGRFDKSRVSNLVDSVLKSRC